MLIPIGNGILQSLVLLFAVTFLLSPLSAVADTVRALHFVLKPIEMEEARRMVDLANDANFNTVVVQLAWGLKLDAAPWGVTPKAWGQKEFVQWLDYARKRGLEVIPEIKLLTHQNKFFQDRFDKLMYNDFTYDPRNEEVYEHVFAMLDEIINIMNPKAIHIGHDEVAGWLHRRQGRADIRVGKLPDNQQMLPANLFLKDTLKIYDYLKSKGIDTWMWGDMLISPDEFPGMLPRHLHGTISGYGRTLRKKLPRDIVICDWHYFDKQKEFPSIDTFRNEGFRVIGATWKREDTIRNFSRYAASHGASGMIATTWFYVPKREWNIVERIIKVSGEVFLKDFPDAK